MFPRLSDIDFKAIFLNEEVQLFLIIALVVFVIFHIYGTVCRWFMFKKAGTKGYFSLIPIYRIVVLTKLAGYKGMKAIFWFIPIANIFYILMYKYNISVRFGYNIGMSLLYVFLPPLALSFFAFKAQYKELEGDPGVVKKKEEFKDIEVDPFKDFKPDLKDNSVPFEEIATAYSSDESFEIDPSSVKLELIDSDLKQEEPVDYDEIPDPTPEELKRPNLKAVAFETEMEAYEKPLTNQEKYMIEKEKQEQEQIIESNELEPEVIMMPNGLEIDDMVVSSDSNSVLAGIEVNQSVLHKESKKKD